MLARFELMTAAAALQIRPWGQAAMARRWTHRRRAHRPLTRGCHLVLEKQARRAACWQCSARDAAFGCGGRREDRCAAADTLNTPRHHKPTSHALHPCRRSPLQRCSEPYTDRCLDDLAVIRAAEYASEYHLDGCNAWFNVEARPWVRNAGLVIVHGCLPAWHAGRNTLWQRGRRYSRRPLVVLVR